MKGASYKEAWKAAVSSNAKGKTIESMEWDDVGAYWLITFTTGEELCVWLLAESPGEKK